jgi:hypothetical protein
MMSIGATTHPANVKTNTLAPAETLAAAEMIGTEMTALTGGTTAARDVMAATDEQDKK